MSAHGTTKTEQTTAARTVAAAATDVDDCRLLLDMLGLLGDLPARRRGRAPAERGHGDPRRYWNGCRCRECTAGVTAYQRDLRARLRADPEAVDRAGHGRERTYRVYGCRCDACRKANTDHCRERRRSRAAADTP